MTEEQKKSRALYMRRYRATHKEETAKIQHKSYMKHQEARIKDARERRARNKEKWQRVLESLD